MGDKMKARMILLTILALLVAPAAHAQLGAPQFQRNYFCTASKAQAIAETPSKATGYANVTAKFNTTLSELIIEANFDLGSAKMTRAFLGVAGAGEQSMNSIELDMAQPKLTSSRGRNRFTATTKLLASTMGSGSVAQLRGELDRGGIYFEAETDQGAIRCQFWGGTQ